MAPFLRRVLLLVIFLLAIAVSGARLSRAQPEKPAVPDRQPREVPNQQFSIPRLPDPLPLDAAPDKPTVAPTGERARLSPNAVILNEGFEGAWPAGLWGVGDFSDIDGGEYLWDDDNCAPRSGGWDAYAVGGGAAGNILPCWGGYPNNVYTWAIYGPFNLAGATAASMTYHFKGSSEGGDECPFDRIFIGRSANGTNFTGPSFCGPWTTGTAGNNYYARTLDLASLLGDDSVWVGFAMVSDNSITDTGFVIDDVTIDVTTSCATPNAPVLSYPPPNASLTDTTPPFAWTSVANANEYEIEVDNNADFSSPVIDQTIGDTGYTSSAALAPGTYHWRVGANNTAGGCNTFSPWSATRTFTITSAPTCYQLTLDKTGQGANPSASPSASSGCAAGRYTAGQAINLTASPAGGWRVGNWQGTNNNGSTANSNTATMPAAAHSVRVNYVQQSSASRAVMPFILYGLTGFLGPREIEPNSTIAEANGPILLNRNYQGFPNDLSDYYYFDLNTTRQLSISLTGITGQDPQLHLYRDSSANRVGYDPDAPYSISYNAPPGRYWVRVVVVGNYNSTSLYTLRVNTP